MKLMSKAFICGLAVAAVAAVGCSGNMAKTTGRGQSGPTTGEVGLNLTLPGGAILNSLNYTLSNGVAADGLTGAITLPSTTVTSLPFSVPTTEIVPVVAATGYIISLSGTSTDGTVTCTGTSGPGTFSVTVGQETVVNVLVSCVKTTSTGSIELNVNLQNCPTNSTLTAILPVGQTTLNDTVPGNTASIFASAVGPNQAAITYAFSVTSGTGTVSAATTAPGDVSSSVTFTCPATGNEIDTITLVTTDGTSTCPTSLTTSTVQVTCGSVTPCQNPTVGNGVEVTGDTATGTCTTGFNSGTLKDGNGFFCCSTAVACNTPNLVGTGVLATPAQVAAGNCGANTIVVPDTDIAGDSCCENVVLAPCTTAGQPDCVQCGGNLTGTGSNGGLCTPTEAKFVAYDISNHVVTAAGVDPSTSCYACLYNNSCIDDTQFQDKAHECEDGTFTTGTSTACENLITCVLGTGLAGSATNCAVGGIANCYCGPQGLVSACTGNPATPTGGCDSVEATGLGFALTDGTDITNNFTSLGLPAGRANQIFACSILNGCPCQ